MLTKVELIVGGLDSREGEKEDKGLSQWMKMSSRCCKEDLLGMLIFHLLLIPLKPIFVGSKPKWTS